jgi:hypothetical protein
MGSLRDTVTAAAGTMTWQAARANLTDIIGRSAVYTVRCRTVKIVTGLCSGVNGGGTAHRGYLTCQMDERVRRLYVAVRSCSS